MKSWRSLFYNLAHVKFANTLTRGLVDVAPIIVFFV